MSQNLKGTGEQETTLLVCFDSAWTANNSGGLVGGLRSKVGALRELGLPRFADFREAEAVILKWQDDLAPTATIVLLDQATIVPNRESQRPVENIVGSVVSRRSGGMHPANTSKEEMFVTKATIWPFLKRFGGSANPLEARVTIRVFENYPILMMIAINVTL